MPRFAQLLALLLVSALISGNANAQCRRSGGPTLGGPSTGGQLLTSPGSWYYDVMTAQARQRAIYQQRMLEAQEKERKRAQRLSYRRARAAQSRATKAREQERRKQNPMPSANGEASLTASLPSVAKPTVQPGKIQSRPSLTSIDRLVTKFGSGSFNIDDLAGELRAANREAIPRMSKNGAISRSSSASGTRAWHIIQR